MHILATVFSATGFLCGGLLHLTLERGNFKTKIFRKVT